MPRKRKSGVKRRGPMKGGSFFGSIGRALGSVVKPVGNFIKDAKLISTGLSLIPHPMGKVAGTVASQLGVGKRRRGHRRQRGGAVPVIAL